MEAVIKQKKQPSRILSKLSFKRNEDGFTLIDALGGGMIIVGILMAATLSFAMHLRESNMAEALKQVVKNNAKVVDNSIMSNDGKLDIAELKNSNKFTGSDDFNELSMNITAQGAADYTLCAWSDLFEENMENAGVKYNSQTNKVSVEQNCSKGTALLGTHDGDNAANNVEQAPVAESPENATEEIDYSSIFVSILLGLSILSVAGFLFWFITVQTRKARAIRRSNIAGWAQLLKNYSHVRDEWGTYELDVIKMIDYPFLSDMKQPETVALHNALRNATRLAPKDARSMANEEPKKSEFAIAVQELETTFAVAESEAKRIRWSNIPQNERKRLETAKRLIEMALDDNGNEHERQAAYRQAQKELEGIIILPKETILSLEKKVTLGLTGSDTPIAVG